jgi:hypothetical protein
MGLWVNYASPDFAGSAIPSILLQPTVRRSFWTLQAATAFFADAIRSHGEPAEITTDRAHALVRVVTDLLPAALHDTTQYANNRVEADHGRLKARRRPMRGLKRDRTASVGSPHGQNFDQSLDISRGDAEDVANLPRKGSDAKSHA